MGWGVGLSIRRFDPQNVGWGGGGGYCTVPFYTTDWSIRGFGVSEEAGGECLGTNALPIQRDCILVSRV